jgi:uncharacterized protein (TIGR02453 family)
VKPSGTLGTPAIQFLKSLKRNNTREWFDAHREQYENDVKAPAKRLAEDLRPLLSPCFPWIEVSTKSIYRINRDTRFSDDKTPYKTWIGYLFRDRRFDKEWAPALYLGLDPTGIAMGAGIWRFQSLQRAIYRERITQSPSDRSFTNAMLLVERAGFEAKGSELKKIPRGYDGDHRNAEYLLHNGLYASKELDFPKSFGTERFAHELARLFLPCKDLMDWMAAQLPKKPG